MTPSRSRFHTCSGGFTLVELMVGCAVLLLIAGALSSILFQSQHSYQSQQSILEVTQDARAAMDQVCTYFRQAGNDPEEYLKDNDIPPIELLAAKQDLQTSEALLSEVIAGQRSLLPPQLLLLPRHEA